MLATAFTKDVLGLAAALMRDRVMLIAGDNVHIATATLPRLRRQTSASGRHRVRTACPIAEKLRSAVWVDKAAEWRPISARRTGTRSAPATRNA